MDKLTIVVTSYDFNRINDAHDLLDSIKFQSYEDIEVIYIVEGSVDLYDAVREYCKGIGLIIRAVYASEKLGLGSARNLGSKLAKGDIVAFVDDDVVLEPNWVKNMVETYSDGIIGVTGSAYPLWQDKKLNWLPKELYWLISCTDWTDWHEITEVGTLWGHSMSFRKEAFEKAGDFAFMRVGEDLEFSNRVREKTGMKLLFNPRVRVGHKVHGYRVGFKFVAKRSRYMGSSRRLLKITNNPQNTNGKALYGIVRIILRLPMDCVKSPIIAWKKLKMISTIISFIGIGYLFPSKEINV